MSSGATSYLFFLQCSVGLEDLLLDEVKALGFRGQKDQGGVSVRAPLDGLYRLCLRSRLTESIRFRIKEFEAEDFPALKKEVEKAPLRAYLAPGAPVRVKVVSHKSRLWHSGAVKQRVEEVLTGRCGLVLDEGDDSHVVHVRVVENRVQLSLEAAGGLHRRGYRSRVERASLRETLAAALVMASGARREHPGEDLFLWDPFCGAGTIVLEALHMSRGVPIERTESFAFTRFRNYDAEAYEALLSEERLVREPHFVAPVVQILGSDISESAVRAARGNYEEGLFVRGEFLVGDIEELVQRVPAGAMILTNPPYGKRLHRGGGVKKLLAVLEQRRDLRPCVALLGGEARSAVPKSAPALFRTKNGGIPVSARLLS